MATGGAVTVDGGETMRYPEYAPKTQAGGNADTDGRLVSVSPRTGQPPRGRTNRTRTGFNPAGVGCCVTAVTASLAARHCVGCISRRVCSVLPSVL